MDPYLIKGPACINTSGGRTSAYMLRQIQLAGSFDDPTVLEVVPFDLKLQDWEGNCDLCFLKGQKKRIRIIRDNPALAQWWIDQEREMSDSFRAHSRTYQQLYQITKNNPELFDTSTEDPIDEIDDLGACSCTY